MTTTKQQEKNIKKKKTKANWLPDSNSYSPMYISYTCTDCHHISTITQQNHIRSDMVHIHSLYTHHIPHTSSHPHPIPLHHIRRNILSPPLPPHTCRREWALRNRITCTLIWPQPRMAPAVSLRGENELWLHGGYSVRFPFVEWERGPGQVEG